MDIPTRPARDPRTDTAEQCLYCASTELVPLYKGVCDRLQYAPGSWSFHRCQGCGSAMLSPRPAEDELADFYPPVYSFAPESVGSSRWRRAWAWLEYQLIYRTMHEGDARRILRRTLGRAAAGKAMLDVGCGRGHRLLAFQRRGCQVAGCDFQPEVTEHIQSELGITAHCCGVKDLASTFRSESFDLVTAFCVVEHVCDVQQMLRGCWALLKPGGWFAAVVPLVDSLQASMFGRRWCQVTEAPRHVSLPSQAGLRTALRRAGFTDVALMADSTPACASSLVLSLLPSATFHAACGQRTYGGILRRMLAIIVAVAALPWCLVENHLVGRPGTGIVLGRRPPDAGSAEVAL